jgi:hypothetical protein
MCAFRYNLRPSAKFGLLTAVSPVGNNAALRARTTPARRLWLAPDHRWDVTGVKSEKALVVVGAEELRPRVRGSAL